MFDLKRLSKDLNIRTVRTVASQQWQHLNRRKHHQLKQWSLFVYEFLFAIACWFLFFFCFFFWLISTHTICLFVYQFFFYFRNTFMYACVRMVASMMSRAVVYEQYQQYYPWSLQNNYCFFFKLFVRGGVVVNKWFNFMFLLL